MNVAIIDDGVDFGHPDLVDAELSEGSADLTRPSPLSLGNAQQHVSAYSSSREGAHGTRCAGEIAARPNRYCGVGIAYRSKISSIKLMSSNSLVTDFTEASAISHASNINHIYACSWGPPDDGSTVEAPGHLTLAAMEQNVVRGRGGLGSIYVFASGNGARQGDNCNYDGYVNDIRTVTIASIDMYDNHPPYSEECSANLAVTYSSINGTEGAIITSDPEGGCKFQTGTSASAPMAAALYAMALQARKELSWRDIQQLTIISAVPVSLSDDSWNENGSGLLYSNKYGYGKLRADYVAELARSLSKLPNLASLVIPPKYILPSGSAKLYGPHVPTIIEFYVSYEKVKDSRVASLEQVTLEISLSYPRRGMLEYYLISPSGTHSKLASARPLDVSSEGLASWKFSTVALWGEPIIGTWTFVVAPVVVPSLSKVNSSKGHYDMTSNLHDVKGTISSLSVTFWGEEGSGGDSTFRNNLRTFWKLHPYSYRIERREGLDHTYIFDKKSYMEGTYDIYVDEDDQLLHRVGSSRYNHYMTHTALHPLFLGIVIAVSIIVFIVIVVLITKMIRRIRANNAPEKLPTSDPNDPPSSSDAPQSRHPTHPEHPSTGDQPSGPMHPDYYPLAGQPPPLSYGTMPNQPMHYHSYPSYPYQDTPPGYVYGINEYQRLPIRNSPGDGPDHGVQ